MPNYRNDMEFDKERSELFMRQVNDTLPPKGELPTDPFTANAVMGQYLWKYRASTPEDENPEADIFMERKGWVTALYLGNRSLREIARETRMSELRADQRRKFTKDVISDVVGIVDQLQRKGTNGARPAPRVTVPEVTAHTPKGIKDRVEELYHTGHLESEQLAVGIILLTDSVAVPTSLAPETVKKLKTHARTQIRSRLERTRAMTGHDEAVLTVKRLVGYERDGITPQSVDELVDEYIRRHNGDRGYVEEHVRHQLSEGLATLYQSYIPTTDEHR